MTWVVLGWMACGVPGILIWAHQFGDLKLGAFLKGLLFGPAWTLTWIVVEIENRCSNPFSIVLWKRRRK